MKIQIWTLKQLKKGKLEHCVRHNPSTWDNMSPKQYFSLLAFYISYLFFGASVFYHGEHRMETERRTVARAERIEINGNYLVIVNECMSILAFVVCGLWNTVRNNLSRTWLDFYWQQLETDKARAGIFRKKYQFKISFFASVLAKFFFWVNRI